MILEKKARALLAEYIEAERKGQDQQADAIENELMENGWRISALGDGTLTVVREENYAAAALAGAADFMTPKENTVQPHKPVDEKPAWIKPTLITVGVLVGAALLTWVVIVIVKLSKPKNAG